MKTLAALKENSGSNWFNSLVKACWVPLFWAILCTAFYWDVLVAPANQIVGGNDLNNMFRIWLDYARSRLSDGQLPLWNPYLNAGYAFVGDPQPALFYPPTWLILLVSTTRGLGWSLVGHIWWSAVGSTYWIHAITDKNGHRISWTASLAGAAVFAFSGFTFARIQAGHIGVITTLAWLPWALGALYQLSTGLSWRTVGWGAVCIGLAFLAGHTASFVYLAYLLGAYTLILTFNLPADKRRHFLWMAAIMGIFALALAGVQLLPTLDLISASSRFGSADYAFASRFSWPAGYIITLLVPNFFGEPVHTGYWGDGLYDELIFYVGILPLLLIWVAGRIRRDQQTRNHIVFWFGVAGVSLFAAFGSNGILHRLLYQFAPLFSSMRAPARAGFLFTCSTAVLTAFAIHSLGNEDFEERKSILAPFTSSMMMGILAITGVLVVCAFGIFAWGKDSNPEAGRFWHIANAIAVFGLFFTLAAGWLRRWSAPSPSHHLSKFALIFIILDLWTLGNGLIRIVPASTSTYWGQVAQHIDKDSGRVLPWGLSIFDQNGALAYKVRSVFAYNPLEDQNYNRYITSKPDPRARIYDLLNVKYVATTVPFELGEVDTLSFLVEDNGVFIYTRSTSLPEAWITPEILRVDDADIISRINDPDFDPLHTALVNPGIQCPSGDDGSTIIYKSPSPEHINAIVEGDGGLLVFSERYASGWKARLDGEIVPIIKANGILRAVCVPPGEHDIHMRYQPVMLIWGSALSTVVLAAICTMLLKSRKHQAV